MYHRFKVAMLLDHNTEVEECDILGKNCYVHVLISQ